MYECCIAQHVYRVLLCGGGGGGGGCAMGAGVSCSEEAIPGIRVVENQHTEYRIHRWIIKLMRFEEECVENADKSTIPCILFALLLIIMNIR